LNATQTLVDRGLVYVSGIIENAGHINLIGGATTNADFRVLTAGASLMGGGTVEMANAKSRIYGATATASLVNVDNTLIGVGQIGVGRLELSNLSMGRIEASGGNLVLNTVSTVTNNGVIQSDGGGTLVVRRTTIDSSGGGIVADYGRMQLDGATLSGGSFTIGTGAMFGANASEIDLAGGTVSNDGAIITGGGGLTIDGDISGGGVVGASGGDLTVTGSLTGTGAARIVGKGVLEVDGSIASNVFFVGTGGELILGGSLSGKIYGFAHSAGGSTLDLSNLTYEAGDTVSYSGNKAGGTLTIKDSSSNVRETIRFAGNYTGSTFVLSQDSGTGTSITDPPAVSRLTSAMASFAPGGAATGSAASHASHAPPVLASPAG
jgi:hypothetical protein